MQRRTLFEGSTMKRRHLSKKEVEHTAWLAHIELSQKEKKLFTEQFNDILDYFKKIDKVDTENVQPTYHVLDLMNVYREDEAKPSLPKEEALKNAPKKEKEFLKAPRIV
jgi:aspartyl-tRNA(Asn)/glutamyl-tRNA(Gln) amidotransferase subunit C